jgi:hypothetical protein
MSSLFAPCLRVELEPHDIATIRNVRFSHYHTSRPTGFPVCTSR